MNWKFTQVSSTKSKVLAFAANVMVFEMRMNVIWEDRQKVSTCCLWIGVVLDWKSTKECVERTKSFKIGMVCLCIHRSSFTLSCAMIFGSCVPRNFEGKSVEYFQVRTCSFEAWRCWFGRSKNWDKRRSYQSPLSSTQWAFRKDRIIRSQSDFPESIHKVQYIRPHRTTIGSYFFIFPYRREYGTPH